MDRDTEYDRVRSIITDLEAAGVTIYKLALMSGHHYNVVKHWKQTGRVESHDARVLGEIHRKFCGSAVICQIDPQYCVVQVVST